MLKNLVSNSFKFFIFKLFYLAFAASGGGELVNLQMILSFPALFSLAIFVLPTFL